MRRCGVRRSELHAPSLGRVVVRSRNPAPPFVPSRSLPELHLAIVSLTPRTQRAPKKLLRRSAWSASLPSGVETPAGSRFSVRDKVGRAVQNPPLTEGLWACWLLSRLEPCFVAVFIRGPKVAGVAAAGAVAVFIFMRGGQACVGRMQCAQAQPGSHRLDRHARDWHTDLGVCSRGKTPILTAASSTPSASAVPKFPAAIWQQALTGSYSCSRRRIQAGSRRQSTTA